MKQAKVSVIVPVYNTEKYLRRCLDSLVNQTIGDIEIVIVNDGSKDSSPAIIEEYLEKYPDKFVYRSQENSGQAAARNLALELCTGEYIGFLDSDDYVKLEMFERMYNKAVEIDADYVACGYSDMTYEEDGTETELVHYVRSKLAYKTKDMFFGAHASPFLHLYKKSVMDASQARFPRGVIYEDTAFYLNLIPYCKKLAVIDEPLAYRTRHANSTTTTIRADRVAHIFTVLDNSLEFYKSHGFYEEYKDELEYFCVRVLFGSSELRIAKVGSRKERKELLIRTIEYVGTNFADYKKNPYFKGGLQNFYMKTFNRATCGLYTDLIRLKQKTERQYT